MAFLGWFGPRGLASIVFTVIVLEDSAVPHVHAITVVVVFTVVLSVFAHGLTSKALTARYAAWFGRHPTTRSRRWRRCRPRTSAGGTRHGDDSAAYGILRSRPVGDERIMSRPTR